MADFKSSDRIRRAKHEKNYTVILNSTIQDSRLSWKARGLHHYILSLPDDWDICIAHLSEQSEPDGEAIVKSALKELEAYGYLTKTRLKDKRGRFLKCVWDIYESPQVDFPLVDKPRKRKASKRSPQVDFPQVDEPQVDKPSMDSPQEDEPQVGNQSLISTYIQSTELKQNTYSQKSAYKNFEKRFSGKVNRFAPQNLEIEGFGEWHLGGSRNDWHEDLIAAASEHLSSHEKPSKRGDAIIFIGNICKGEDWAKFELLTEKALEKIQMREKVEKTHLNIADRKKIYVPPHPREWTDEQKTWTDADWQNYLGAKDRHENTSYA